MRWVTRLSLRYSQRDLVAQELGVMHQVSYSSFVSTSCRNEKKDRNYECPTAYFHFLFFFRKKIEITSWKMRAYDSYSRVE